MPNLGWYLKRLRAMTAAEVAYRIRQQTRAAFDRLPALQPKFRHLDPAGELASFRARAPLLVPDLTDVAALRARYEGDFPAGRARTIASADAIMQGRVTLFGQEFDVGPSPDWHRDPRTGKRWPQKFWTGLDTRDGSSIGGVKWVWELNRHHHLVSVAKAYVVTASEEYSAFVLRQLLDWIEANPYATGVNWASPLELSVRTVNWLHALAMMSGSRNLRPETFAGIQDSIASQIRFVERHKSAFSSANNHLVGELAGIALTGLMLPWIGDAAGLPDAALEELGDQLERQIHPDGVPAEQAFGYLSFVLDLYLVSYLPAQRAGAELPPSWIPRLRAVSHFLAHMLDEQGRMPNIGDADDAIVVRLDESPGHQNHRSLLVTLATLLAESVPESAGPWDEKSAWLLGHAESEAYRSLPPAPEPRSRVFRDGGYAVLRADQTLITVDCGPLGYLRTAAHGHADALSVTLRKGGAPLLVDPGTYAYQEAGPWREYFRSTRAHNTVTVDGQDQSSMEGTFLWGSRAHAEIVHWESNAERDVFIAEHDGYLRLGVMHRRSVTFLKPDWLFIRDELRGGGSHVMAQHWHLAPDAAVDMDETVVTARSGDQTLSLIGLTWSAGEASLLRGARDPLQGWYSSHYGHKESAPVVVVEAIGSENTPIETALFLGSLRDKEARAAALSAYEALRPLTDV